MPRPPQYLTGKRFGLLTVLHLVSRNSHGNSRWMCRCDCGKEIEAMYQNLKREATKSCGCLPRGRKPKV